MMDERSEAVGYAKHYAQQEAFQARADRLEAGRQAIKWLLEEVVLAHWNESPVVILETLEGMQAPALVLEVLREMVPADDA